MYLCNSELVCVLNRLGEIIAGWVEELACHQKLQHTIPDSQGQVSNDKLGYIYRVWFI